MLSLNLTTDDLLAGGTSNGTQKTSGAGTYCTNLSGGIFALINFEIILGSFHHWTSRFCRLRGVPPRSLNRVPNQRVAGISGNFFRQRPARNLSGGHIWKIARISICTSSFRKPPHRTVQEPHTSLRAPQWSSRSSKAGLISKARLYVYSRASIRIYTQMCSIKRLGVYLDYQISRFVESLINSPTLLPFD